MSCEEIPGVIDAYLDGELSVAVTLQAHGHFATCDNCRRILESEAALHGLLVQSARAEPVPSELRAGILGGILIRESTRAHSRRRLTAKFGIVLGLVGLAALGWLAAERLVPHPMTPLAAELAGKHLLYGGQHGGTLELTTSEPAKMSAWFHDRLGFPVRLPSIAKRPEQLVGGRISSVADAPAAYALYNRSGRAISLFVARRVPFARRGWTERHLDGAELYFASLRGVALIWWEDGSADRLYAAASEGDEDTLAEFALRCIRKGQASVPPSFPGRSIVHRPDTAHPTNRNTINPATYGESVRLDRLTVNIFTIDQWSFLEVGKSGPDHLLTTPTTPK